MNPTEAIGCEKNDQFSDEKAFQHGLARYHLDGRSKRLRLERHQTCPGHSKFPDPHVRYASPNLGASYAAASEILVLVAALLASMTTAGAQTVPDARAHHQLVYHAGQEKVYLIGGSTRRGDSYHYFNDVWSREDSTWVLADTLPFPRSSHRMVYHGGRNSLVLFGGGSHETFAEDGALWEWRGGLWSKLDEHPRTGRAEPGMCYDARRRRIVLFGGWDESNLLSGVTWEWDGDEIIEVATRGPSARAGHALIFDPQRERCLLFGGRDDEALRSDTWEWDGESWRELDVSGPTPRWFFGAAVDELRERVVLFGGTGQDGDYSDTWAWDGERWRQISTEGPAGRGMPRLAFDGSHVILFGGRERTGDGFVDRNDTWLLSGSSWIRAE